MTEIGPFTTPDEMAQYANESGNSARFLSRSEEMVLLEFGGSGPAVAFVRGAIECRVALAKLRDVPTP